MKSLAIRNRPIRQTRPSRVRGRAAPVPHPGSDARARPGEIRRRLDLALRAGWVEEGAALEAGGLEWAMVDTRRCDAGAYLLRAWTDRRGTTRRIKHAVGPRRGGAIGLFTLQDQCASAGPCSPLVDEGAGLLLMGFANMLALPLTRRAAEALDANWLLVMTDRREAFRDRELGLLLGLVQEVLEEYRLGDASEFPRPPRALDSRTDDIDYPEQGQPFGIALNGDLA